MTQNKARTILDGIESKSLFARWFSGPSWSAWKSFLSVLFALPLDSADLTTYRKHTNRVQAPTKAFNEAWLVVGRRGGNTSVLRVLDLRLVVAGDVIHNGVHQYLSESGSGGRDAWLKAIDMVEARHPRWIIAGHKNKALDDDAARTIAETRQYLADADELLQTHRTALDFFSALLDRYSSRLNPGALWSGAKALYMRRWLNRQRLLNECTNAARASPIFGAILLNEVDTFDSQPQSCSTNTTSLSSPSFFHSANRKLRCSAYV